MDTEITTMELQFRKERDELYYRERAVDQALVLMKQNRDSASAESLVHNANVLYNFIKGNSNE
jgi:predicted S18 family serine protease